MPNEGFIYSFHILDAWRLTFFAKVLQSSTRDMWRDTTPHIFKSKQNASETTKSWRFPRRQHINKNKIPKNKENNAIKHVVIPSELCGWCLWFWNGSNMSSAKGLLKLDDWYLSIHENDDGRPKPEFWDCTEIANFKTIKTFQNKVPWFQEVMRFLT